MQFNLQNITLVMSAVILGCYIVLFTLKKMPFKQKLPILSAINSAFCAVMLIFAAINKQAFLIDLVLVYVVFSVIFVIFIARQQDESK